MNGTAFMIFILPFFVGAIIRLMFFKWKRGCVLSAILAAISIIAWLWTKYLTTHGVDGTVMLWALMASEAAVASFVIGGISFLVKKIKKQTKTE